MKRTQESKKEKEAEKKKKSKWTTEKLLYDTEDNRTRRRADDEEREEKEERRAEEEQEEEEEDHLRGPSLNKFWARSYDARQTTERGREKVEEEDERGRGGKRVGGEDRWQERSRMTGWKMRDEMPVETHGARERLEKGLFFHEEERHPQKKRQVRGGSQFQGGSRSSTREEDEMKYLEFTRAVHTLQRVLETSSASEDDDLFDLHQVGFSFFRLCLVRDTDSSRPFSL